MMTIDEAVAFMRAAGIRRIRTAEANNCYAVQVEVPGAHENRWCLSEIELSDTIPAPPSFETMPTDFPPAESKDPSLCAGVGCSVQGGWHGTAYCRAHGLSAAGVKS